jgi:hypothetical protein
MNPQPQIENTFFQHIWTLQLLAQQPPLDPSSRNPQAVSHPVLKQIVKNNMHIMMHHSNMQKSKNVGWDGAEEAMTGDDCCLMLHCTIGHMSLMDGAQPDFEDGLTESSVSICFAPKGEHTSIFCNFFIFFIFCIYSGILNLLWP